MNWRENQTTGWMKVGIVSYWYIARPFFTYWLMFVHTLILIVSLSVYGFAPYGFDQFSERALVQQSSLVVEVVEKNITPNVWGGPPQVWVSG